MDATGHFNSLKEAYFYYEWSTYVICLAKYMLSDYEQRFDEKTMDDLIKEFENYAGEMKEVYTSIYNYIEIELPKSIVERVKQGGEFLMNGLENMPVASFNIFGVVGILAAKAGGAFGKKTLEDNREKNKQNTLDTFANTEKLELTVFIDKVSQIKDFYNKPVDMLVDSENVYIKKIAA